MLYCNRPGTNSAQILKLDLASNAASVWKTLKPTDPAGVFTLGVSDITPDGRRYIAIYGRILSDLFLVDGLR